MKNKTLRIIFTLILTNVMLISSTSASIVYTNVDPDVTAIIPNSPSSVSDILSIDFNNDGTEEFNFRWDRFPNNQWFVHTTFVQGNELVLIEGAQNPFGASYIEPLEAGTTISTANNFGAGYPEPLIGDDINPNFQGLGNRYIGVKFDINGQTHYGWILISFAASITDGSLNLTIQGYAYDDSPDAAIIAGDTGNGNLTIYNDDLSSGINLFVYQNQLIINTEEEAFEVKLYSLAGRLVFKANSKMINLLPNLNSGIYIATFNSNSNHFSKTIYLR